MGYPPISCRQTLCSEFAAVLGSLFAYFFYIVTAFAALTGLMIVAFSGDSTLGKALHYPRPIVERTIAATSPRRPLYMLATKQESQQSIANSSPTSPAKDLNGSGVPLAKADAEKGKREKPAHPHKLASRLENYGGQDYSVALGNAAGYRPGLDGQR
jgi:hypothetical protein